MESDIPVILILLIAGVLYILPLLVAYERVHHQRAAIAVLNVLLGWTLIGWVGALVWACTVVHPRSVSPEIHADQTPSLSARH